VPSAWSLSSTIGGKILSGRTKDQNIGYIAEYLTAIDIDLKEVRVVGDEERDRRLGEMLARSLRVSNRKLRKECAWVPKYPSMREGWRAVAAAIQPLEPRGEPRGRTTMSALLAAQMSYVPTLN